MGARVEIPRAEEVAGPRLVRAIDEAVSRFPPSLPRVAFLSSLPVPVTLGVSLASGFSAIPVLLSVLAGFGMGFGALGAVAAVSLGWDRHVRSARMADWLGGWAGLLLASPGPFQRRTAALLSSLWSPGMTDSAWSRLSEGGGDPIRSLRILEDWARGRAASVPARPLLALLGPALEAPFVPPRVSLSPLPVHAELREAVRLLGLCDVDDPDLLEIRVSLALGLHEAMEWPGDGEDPEYAEAVRALLCLARSAAGEAGEDQRALRSRRSLGVLRMALGDDAEAPR